VTTPSEFWQLLVYCSETAHGSPTGVVFPGENLSPDQYQATATALGYPDTVFLTQGSRDSEGSARSFSPAQELSLCTQALIAAFRVLQETGRPMPSTDHILFGTLSGPIVVGELVPERKDIAWLVGPFRVLARRVSESPLAAFDARDRATEILIDKAEYGCFGKCRTPVNYPP
jgi:predicted PhzF superfamily epimerase YddE/YHI9